MEILEIKGCITDPKTLKGVADCSVELWSKNLQTQQTRKVNLERDCITAIDGTFTMVAESGFIPDIQNTYYINVYKESILIFTTEETSLDTYFQQTCKIEITNFPNLILFGPNRMRVHGRVINAEGVALPDLSVKAFDKRMNNIAELGLPVFTDAGGYYTISYDASDFGAIEKSHADLIVEVSDPSNPKADVLTSPLILAARHDETINILYDRSSLKTKSEFSVIAGAILADAELQVFFSNVDSGEEGINDFERILPKDISYLENKLHVQHGMLSRYFQSVFLTRKFKLIEERSVEFMYGLFSDETISSLDNFLFTSNAKIRELLITCENRGLIDHATETDINAFLTDLKDKIKAFILDNSTSTDMANALSCACGNEVDAKNFILDTVIQYAERSDRFRDKFDLIAFLDANKNTENKLTSAIIETFEFLLQVTVVSDSLQLGVNLYNSEFNIKSIEALITATDNNIINNIPLGIIPDIFSTPAEYIAFIRRNIETHFNEKVLVANILKESTFPLSTAKVLFGAFPDFDFTQNLIEEQLNGESQLVDTLSEINLQTLNQEMKSLQRIYNLVPKQDNYPVICKLLQNGMTSAADIVKRSESAFVADFKSWFAGGTTVPRGLEIKARAIYQAAFMQSSKALMTWTRYGKDFNTVATTAFKTFTHNISEQGSTATFSLPTLSDLFKSIDYCQCSDCRSILSPAAYLADLLAFLKEMSSPANQPAPINLLAKLFDRRPDLGRIKLNCVNTNTLLPFIDLVNEILGYAVEGKLFGGENEVMLQTTLDAKSLRALPEHLDKISDAINLIAQQVYPWEGPFNFWLEEQRAYLRQLSLSRYELMRKFPKVYSENPDLYTGIVPNIGVFNISPFTYVKHAPNDCTAEYLGMTVPEFNSITVPHTSDELITYFGIKSGENLLDLKCVDDFLAHSKLSYDEVVAVMKSYFVNPITGTGSGLKRISILFTPQTSCDISLANFFYNDGSVPPDADFITFLDRFHRFVLLKRKLQWSVRELDLVIKKLNLSTQSEISAGLITKIAFIQKLRSITNLTVEEVLLWYADFDTDTYEGETPLYDSIFRNSALNDPTNTAFAPGSNTGFRLDDNAVRPTILGALNLSENDFLYLLGFDPENPDVIGQEKLITNDSGNKTVNYLSVANLSKLFRVVSFCHAFRLTFREYYLLVELAQLTPSTQNELNFDLATAPDESPVSEGNEDENTVDSTGIGNPGEILSSSFPINHGSWQATQQNTFNYLDRLSAIRNAGFSVFELYYLLFGCEKNVSSLFISNTTIEEIVVDLHQRLIAESERLLKDSCLNEVNNGTSVSAAKRMALKAFLSPFMPPAIIPDAVALVLNEMPNDLGSENQEQIIDDYFSRFMNPEEAKANLLSSSPTVIAQQNNRANYILSAIIKEQITLFIVKEVSAHLGIDEMIVRTAMSEFIFCTENSTYMLGVYLQSWFTGLTPASTQEPDYSVFIKCYLKLYKAAVFIRKYKIDLKTCVSLHQYSLTFKLLNIFDLPTANSISATPQLDYWVSFDQAFYLDTVHFRKGVTLFDLLGQVVNPANSLGHVLQQLIDATGWDGRDVRFLAMKYTAPPFAISDITIEWLIKLAEQLKITSYLSVSAYSIVQHNPAIISSQVSLFYRNLLKTHFGNAQWLKIMSPIMDDLRTKLRDAFVNHLICNGYTNPDTSEVVQFTTPFQIYDYFLIDPEMMPVCLTSRIKQATLTVQLFVQRVLMNLESGLGSDLIMDEEAKEEWLWRKNYRVWEANRKVFLYPENYLEPAVRMGKSSFFIAAENFLKQNDITAENAEKAFHDYVEKLEEVANLEIVSSYFDQDTNDHHVVSRTRNHPHNYYYRRFVNQSYWTAWEKMDVKIEGDNLALVVWNRQLFAFWAVTQDGTKVTDLTTNGTVVNEGSVPEKHMELKIAWSRYKNGKWDNKQESKEWHRLGWDSTSLDLSQCYLFPLQDGKDFVKLIYLLPFHDCEYPHFTSKRNIVIRIDEDMTVDYSFGSKELFYAFPFHDIPLVKSNKAHYLPGDIVFKEWLSFPDCAPPSPGTFIDNLILTCGQKNSLVNSSKNLLHQGSFPSQSVRDSIFIENNTRTFFARPVTQLPNKMSGSNIAAFILQKQVQKTANTLKFANFTAAHPERSNNLLQTDTYYSFGEQSLVINGADRTDQAIASGGATVSNENTGRVTDMTIPPPVIQRKYYFRLFYHPFVPLFIHQLQKKGIDGLLNPDRSTEESCSLARQLAVRTGLWSLSATTTEPLIDGIPDPANTSLYIPNSTYVLTGTYLPREDIDFSPDGAYSEYNWELFFHLPLTVAQKLSQNCRYEESQKWYHYIFDPTDRNPAFIEQESARFWKVKPFYQLYSQLDGLADIRTLMESLAGGNNALEQQIELWRSDPFNPHLIAQLRHLSYMKSVVMMYLDNLIAWGDQMFEQDTLESINVAVQLYVLAAEILGPRPVMVGKQESTDKTFNEIAPDLDAFSNCLVEIENFIAIATAGNNNNQQLNSSADGGAASITFVTETGDKLLNDAQSGKNGSGFIIASVYKSLYFGIPYNDKLLGYWDQVEDRLFKVHNSMNIKGIQRQLPLFEPPIDPMLLIRAKASGLDLTSVLNSLNTPLPFYRFRAMLAKAQEVCNDMKSLGSALLTTLEKKDAEELSLLRATHEKTLLTTITNIKEKAVEDALTNIEIIEFSKQLPEGRLNYYATRENINTQEELHLDKLQDAMQKQLVAQGLQVIAGSMSLLPNFDIGINGLCASPKFSATWGGVQIAASLNTAAGVLNLLAGIDTYQANKASILGGYKRRWDEWQFQKDQAAREIAQIEKQKLAAEIKLELAKFDLSNHQLQISQSEAVNTFLNDKFSNADLYNWMITQISQVYFDSYKMAFALAKQAERAFRFETGSDNEFINFGHWDNLKKGLLAGDLLQYQLRQLDLAYMEQNERRFEITKHVSLAALNPDALHELKIDGTTEFEITEMLYDLDFPGQYMRRIKSVAITIPAVTGPYTSIPCKLTMLNNRFRKETTNASNYPYVQNDIRFEHNVIGIQSIATSHAQNDKGMFEFSFNDERYLPFEGAGAIGRWQIELPNEFRQFDYNSISDVILHIQYTSLDAGGILKTNAIENITTNLNKLLDELNGSRLMLPIEWKADFADELYQLCNPVGSDGVDITLKLDNFPGFIRDYRRTNTDKLIKIEKLSFLIKGELTGYTINISGITPNNNPPGVSVCGNQLDLFTGEVELTGVDQILVYEHTYNINIVHPQPVTPKPIENIWMVVNYTLS